MEVRLQGEINKMNIRREIERSQCFESEWLIEKQKKIKDTERGKFRSYIKTNKKFQI